MPKNACPQNPTKKTGWDGTDALKSDGLNPRLVPHFCSAGKTDISNVSDPFYHPSHEYASHPSTYSMHAFLLFSITTSREWETSLGLILVFILLSSYTWAMVGDCSFSSSLCTACMGLLRLIAFSSFKLSFSTTFCCFYCFENFSTYCVITLVATLAMRSSSADNFLRNFLQDDSACPIAPQCVHNSSNRS